jgi:hypothetical protein
MPHKEPAKLSDRALKRIHASSLRLTGNIDRAQIREMIRRGFFSKAIWLDELDVLQSVAREIMNDCDGEGRTMLEIDPELRKKAKEIVDIRTPVPPKERRPGAAATKTSRKSKLP